MEGIFFSFPSAKKPIHRPSGDQKGLVAPLVPERACASIPAIRPQPESASVHDCSRGEHNSVTHQEQERIEVKVSGTIELAKERCFAWRIDAK